MTITTLIPAFKVTYFAELVSCLNHQSVKPDKIIVSDDSSGNEFLKASREEWFRRMAGGLDIELLEGPKQGQYANMRFLVNSLPAETHYFHLLCDDDLIYPEFYRMHLQSLSRSDAQCSFSKRWVSTETGQPSGVACFPGLIMSSSDRLLLLEPEFLFKSTLPEFNNWIGEFSNIVFRKSADSLLLDPKINGICHYGLFDLGIVLRCAMAKGSMFVNEHLGVFRQSPSQHSSQIQSPTMKSSAVAWIALSIAAYQLKYLNEEELFRSGRLAMNVIRRNYAGDAKMERILSLEPEIAQQDSASYIEKFLPLWPSFHEHIHPSLL